MQEADIQKELISQISGILSRYYYLSEVIEGMGIPLFEVIENAQKENQSFALRQLYPESAKDPALFRRLTDPSILQAVLRKLIEQRVLVRCAWLIDEISVDGKPAFLIKIGVYNKGHISESLLEEIRGRTGTSSAGHSIADYFGDYSEERMSAGIGLPMLNFLMEEFQQKGITVNFSIYNASKGDNIIAEMNFVI
jgi:hypothetical protein